MIPIVSIVGRSESGKTTLLEGIIPLLVQKGYAIGTIKHTTHVSSLDREGKDSWRHAQAGAKVALISTPRALGIFRSLEQEKGWEELIDSYLSDVDLVLAEGFKAEKIPKIEVLRGQPRGELLTKEDPTLLAVVSDSAPPVEVPHFSLEDYQGLANFLEERLLRRSNKEEIRLQVDGQRVPLNPFVQDLFHSMVLAMLSPLKGIGSFSRVSLHLERTMNKKISGT